MKRLALFLLLVACTAAFAQAPTRVRGTIASLDGDLLSVKSRDGKDLKIRLAPDLGVATAKSATLADMKGKYVGVTAVNKGGRLVALEVHSLPPQVKPGHMAWDLAPGSTMTNANLEGIAQASGGSEITMNYQGGSQKILVPSGTPVVTFVPGSRADLKVGEYIWTLARQEADGKIVTQRISVSKNGVKPPH
jgi:hypothetical protein